MNQVPFEAEIPQGKLILSRTDTKGKITYANETFAHVSGYKPEELIGKAHSIVRHPDMPRSIFKQMWDTIEAGKIFRGYVKNLRKDGGYYWVDATIEPLFENGKIVGYKSSRAYVPPMKRQQMEKKYAAISSAEEGNKTLTITLEKGAWEKLQNYSKYRGITYQEAIQQLIDNIQE